MKKRLLSSLLGAGFIVILATTSALANIDVVVDKARQEMTVSVDQRELYVWPVSTGNRTHETPTGEYRAFRMEENHFSAEFDDAPMPNSIFFTMRGHAIHGSFETRNLGRAVSHGCVRLHPNNAKLLYALVKQERLEHTTVIIIDGVQSAPQYNRRPAPPLNLLPFFGGYR